MQHELLTCAASLYSSVEFIIRQFHPVEYDLQIVKYALAHWLRASDSRLREPGFESCAVRLKSWASFSLYIAPVHSAV